MCACGTVLSEEEATLHSGHGLIPKMVNFDLDAYFRFLARRERKLKEISSHARGEVTFEDVKSEVLMTLDRFASKGVAINLDDLAHQELVISHLYQRLVRYTELNVRHAVRLDHSPKGEEDQAHPLAHLLAAENHYDPLNALIQAEEDAPEFEPNAHQSLAGAYLQLLRRFDNRMAGVADHLLISVSYCYRRCAHARHLAVHQRPLPPNTAANDAAFIPGAWRRFRAVRQPIQLSFEFLGEAGLFEVT